jgi:small subunit ribosomal protein S8
MMTDPIADMFTRIRNANSRYKEKVDVPASKLKEEILRVFQQEGFVSSYKKIEDYKQGILRIYLKYSAHKEKVITGMKRMSKPGLRVYRPCDKLPRVYRGLGEVIISTSRGVMTGKEARKQHLGGEVICAVW